MIIPADPRTNGRLLSLPDMRVRIITTTTNHQHYDVLDLQSPIHTPKPRPSISIQRKKRNPRHSQAYLGQSPRPPKKTAKRALRCIQVRSQAFLHACGQKKKRQKKTKKGCEVVVYVCMCASKRKAEWIRKIYMKGGIKQVQRGRDGQLCKKGHGLDGIKSAMSLHHHPKLTSDCHSCGS